MREIKITEIENILIGQCEDAEAGTGVTVFINEKGMAAGLDVRGGGPASRESELLKPLALAQEINAVLISGGSAFGLDAAGGVMQALEERGIGYDVGVTKVPLVCQSALFDLGIGDCFKRPDKEMGYKAALAALSGGNYKDGNFGAGCGATVGKLFGLSCCMKSGIGSYAVSVGDFKLGAVAAVNSFGDIFDEESGKQLAGLTSEDKQSLRNTEEIMFSSYETVENKFTGNTTLVVIITNGKFNKVQLSKISGMAHNGLARAIRPVHTGADGDTVYALSVGVIEADIDMAGSLAAHVVSKAIKRAVLSAGPAYGLPCAADFIK